MLTQFGLVWL